MRDKELYRQILNIQEPWFVEEVDLDREAHKVTVRVGLTEKAIGVCPDCNEACSGYDHRVRRWRHLDTCQYETIIEAQILRINCKRHGVISIPVPWAEPGSGFTALFEALVIDWLKEATISAVAKQMGLSWSAVDGIMKRAVARGLARREIGEIKHIGIDETSFQKHHEYVSVVTDTEKDRVLYVADGHKAESLDAFFDGLTVEQKGGIESVSIDMWEAYIKAIRKHLEDADSKIAFDKFHVAKHLGEAVDKVRKLEHKNLMAENRTELKGTKYQWLRNPSNMTNKQRREFSDLKEKNLKTARAWALKETAMHAWKYISRAWAEKAWISWLSWAVRSRLAPMKSAAKMIKKHLWGILNAIVLGVSNGPAEGMNCRIQKIKRMACGYRNRERFRNAIYFHLGDLDLYPS